MFVDQNLVNKRFGLVSVFFLPLIFAMIFYGIIFNCSWSFLLIVHSCYLPIDDTYLAVKFDVLLLLQGCNLNRVGWEAIN